MLTNASPFGLIKIENYLIKAKPINEQMWYSKFNQTFVNYKRKWNCFWKNKIHRNKINVSIHWVQIHVQIFREENFSYNIHNSHNL